MVSCILNFFGAFIGGFFYCITKTTILGRSLFGGVLEISGDFLFPEGG